MNSMISNDSKMHNNTSVATFLKTKHCGNKNNFNEAYSFLTNKCLAEFLPNTINR